MLDWTSIILATVAAVAPTLAALGSWRVSKMNNQKLNSLHVEVNSRLSELIKASTDAAHRSGILVGMAAAKSDKIVKENTDTQAQE